MGIAAAIAAGTAVAGLGGALLSYSASSDASNAQQQSAANATGEQQRQFNQTQANYAPFLAAGRQALGQQGDLLGMNGNAPQQSAITGLEGSPYYQSLYNNGRDAVLANASATGGLRGGNVQTGLFNSARDTLAQTIQQQLANLGGIAGNGQGAAGSLGTFGQRAADQIGMNYQNMGDAQGRGALAQAGIWNNSISQTDGLFNKYLNSSFGGGGNPFASTLANNNAYTGGLAQNGFTVPTPDVALPGGF